MRVGFDLSPLERPHPRGIVRLVRELVEALERRGHIQLVRLTPEPGASLRSWRQRDLPGMVRELELAGVHSFLSAYPLRGPGRRVQTVHELPWKYGVQENADWRHRFWASIGTRRADAILTATHFVARALGRSPFVRAGRVRVCPWGVGPPFEEEPPPGVVDEVVLGRYRLPESPLILCVGAVRPKKNLAAVLRGAARLKQRGDTRWHVVVSGEETPQLRRDLGLVARSGLSRWVSTPGPVPDEDLPSLLRCAAVVPVLSHSEGFGLTVLEALACGTPVVVPKNSAQAEVAGERAFLVEPEDPDSVADGLARAIAAREELRFVLPERAAEFSWERCAEQVEELWLSLL